MTGAVGLSYTIKGLLLLHPSIVLVYVNTTFPDETPLTNPVFVIVATDGLLLFQVPLDDGVIVAVLPTQTKSGPPKTGLDGIG